MHRAVVIAAVLATDARADELDDPSESAAALGYEEIDAHFFGREDELFDSRAELFVTGGLVVSRDREDSMPPISTTSDRHPFFAVGLRNYNTSSSSLGIAVASDVDRYGALVIGGLHVGLSRRLYFDFGTGAGAYLFGGGALLARATIGVTYFAGDKLAIRIGPEGTFSIGRGDSSLGGGLGVGLGWGL